MAERLQKILANTGLGSRREVERQIAAGEVRLNGQLAKLGDRAAADDNLTISGRFYKVVSDTRDKRRVIAYHKPLGEVTSRDDPDHSQTVFDHLPRLHQGRWIAIGRLDINTLGLLLLTNDGQLANTLMHPSAEVQREYAVRVHGQVTDAMLAALHNGVELEDGRARFDRVRVEGAGEGSNQWYRVVLHEGRNREVRRLWESQGLTVSRLIRVRYGTVALPKWLARGRVHELVAADIDQLAASAGSRAESTDTLRVIPVHPRHRRRAQRRRR